MIVCVVPRDLERRLAGRLNHALAGTDVHVVVDRRTGDERRARDRRRGAPARERRLLERRHVRSADGRRIADRRAPVVPVERPPLPWRVRGAAQQVAFVSPLEAPAELREDVQAARAVIRWQLGDQSALEELYLTWFDRAYAFAQVSLGAAGTATDAVQEAFGASFGRLGELDPTRTAFRAWLFADVLEAVRTRTPGDAPETRDPGPPPAGGGGEITALRWVNDRELALLVRRLPEREREAVLLRYAGGLCLSDVAALLDLDLRGEQLLTCAALGRLRHRLTDLGGGRVESSQREAMRRLSQPSTVLRGRRLALHTG